MGSRKTDGGIWNRRQKAPGTALLGEGDIDALPVWTPSDRTQSSSGHLRFGIGDDNDRILVTEFQCCSLEFLHRFACDDASCFH